MDKLLKEITIEDLPNEELKLIATYCGMEVVLVLINKLPGLTVTIPRFAYKKMIKAYVKKHYGGTRNSKREIALKWGVSELFVYNVIRELKL